jgi:hypothetical protein
MVNHLKSDGHKDAYDRYLKAEEERKTPTNKGSQQIDRFFAMPYAKKCERLWSLVAALDSRALTFMESAIFREALRHTSDSRFTGVTADSVRTTLLQIEANEIKPALHRLMASVDSVAYTTDLWSDESGHSYATITAHYVEPTKPQLSSSVLAFQRFPGRHTAQAVGAWLSKELKAYNIREKIWFGIADGAPAQRNALSSVEGLPYWVLWCAAHRLHLVVTDAMKTIKDLIKLVRSLVSRIKRSSVLTEASERHYATLHDEHPRKLILDVCTRWNSTLAMMESIHKRKLTVQYMCAENAQLTALLNEWSDDLEVKSDDPVRDLWDWEWDAMEHIIPYLQYAEGATAKWSASQAVTLSTVLPTCAMLVTAWGERNALLKSNLKFTTNTDTRRSLETALKFGETLLSSIHSRFSVSVVSDVTEPYWIASYLDPRFREFVWISDPAERQKARGTALLWARKWLNELFRRSPDLKAKYPSTAQPPATSTPAPTRTTTGHFVINLSQYCASTPPLSEDAVTEYDRLPFTAAENDNPLQIWAGMRPGFEGLRCLAYRFLSAPASSVASEAVFSKAGRLREPRRNRLNGDTMETLILIKANAQLLPDVADLLNRGMEHAPRKRKAADEPAVEPATSVAIGSTPPTTVPAIAGASVPIAAATAAATAAPAAAAAASSSAAAVPRPPASSPSSRQ